MYTNVNRFRSQILVGLYGQANQKTLIEELKSAKVMYASVIYVWSLVLIEHYLGTDNFNNKYIL